MHPDIVWPCNTAPPPPPQHTPHSFLSHTASPTQASGRRIWTAWPPVRCPWKPHRLKHCVATDYDSPRRCLAGPPQHGLSANTMAQITSDCVALRFLSTEWPKSPRIVSPAGQGISPMYLACPDCMVPEGLAPTYRSGTPRYARGGHRQDGEPSPTAAILVENALLQL